LFSSIFNRSSSLSIWQCMSSIILLRNNSEWIDFSEEIGIMCWDKENKIEEFSKGKLKGIITEGDQGTKTDYKIINEPGEVSWVVLRDSNFEDLISTSYTVCNAISQLINEKSVMGVISNYKIRESQVTSFLNPDHSYYLIFNQKPLGYYPLVYENNIRQSLSEIEIIDLVKKEKLYVNKNQNTWFGVEKIPF